MKKILYHTLSLLFASFFFASCEKESFQVTFEHGEGVTLRLRLSNNDLQSRAEGDRNDNEYNENAIKKVDLYLYKIDSDGKASGQALKKVSKTFETINEVELVTSLSNTEKENLFGNGTTCRAYALVNYTGTAPLANTDDSKIAALKALEITPNSTNKTFAAEVTKDKPFVPQPSFVMDGENNVTYDASDRIVTGTINVSRAASKISLFITSVEKTVTDAAGNIWEPDYGKMAITFHNGVNKATVDVGYTATTPARPNNTLAVGDNIYESSGIRDITATCTNLNITTDLTWKLTTSHAPFYSYSYDWANAANDDKNPIITIMVPWRKISEKDSDGKIVIIPETDRDTKTTWQTCYYQIPVNAESKNGSLAECLERNMYYIIKLHVGILGDFNPATATKIPASYYTVDWQNQDVEVDIKNYKYLVVDKNDVTVYNENEVRIGYASSDPIKAEITYIRRPDYAKTVERVDSTYYYGSLSTSTGTTSVSEGPNSLLRTCSVAVEGNEIVLSHDLVNQSNASGSNYDYVPYYIWIKVTMTVQVNGQNKTFTEWIRYEQYPAVYVKGDKNTAYGTSSSKGNVYINQQNNSNTSSWYSVNGLGSGSGSSSSPYMYVITVTALSEDSEYIIADPRSNSINLLNYNNWGSAPALYGETPRKLTYYYPTLTNEDYENYISPQFRICSGYGRLGSSELSWEEAERRCAAYQEDGYPAGRWRLPTTAELRFVGKLCAEKKIPTLFTDGNNYWSASNSFKFSSTNGTFNEVNDADYVRCVYDDWYWGNERVENTKTTFTWGDAERN